MSETLKDKIEGEIDMDLHGNISYRKPGVKIGS
jgi:hypothetical protein